MEEETFEEETIEGKFQPFTKAVLDRMVAETFPEVQFSLTLHTTKVASGLDGLVICDTGSTTRPKDDIVVLKTKMK